MGIEKGDNTEVVRVEPLGELLVKAQALSPAERDQLLEEQLRDPGKRLGELAMDQGMITHDELVASLRVQQEEKQSVATGLEGSAALSDDERLGRLLQHERLGEILLRRRIIHLSQLIAALHEQLRDPEKTLGEILVKMGVLTPEERNEALELQAQQKRALAQTHARES